MPRPKKPRCIRFRPDIRYFKPQGIRLRELQEVSLKPDEIEALKLHDLDELNHQQAADTMNISQPTFGRILDRAYKKIATALINGHAIKLETKKETQ